MIGCDGVRSSTKEQLDFQMEGESMMTSCSFHAKIASSEYTVNLAKSSLEAMDDSIGRA